jgi:hypothetical protein
MDAQLAGAVKTYTAAALMAVRYGSPDTTPESEEDSVSKRGLMYLEFDLRHAKSQRQQRRQGRNRGVGKSEIILTLYEKPAKEQASDKVSKKCLG